MSPLQDTMVLDAKRRLGLLEMSFDRLAVSASYALLVGLAMLTWAALDAYPVIPMALWTLAIGLLWPLIRHLLKRFRCDMAATLVIGKPALTIFYRHWYRIVCLLAALLGGLLGTLTLVNAGVPSFDFLLLLTVTVAIMMIVYAAHQTPILSVYFTYYAFAWGGTLMTMPIVFPERWPYLFGLGLIHAGSTAVDARRVSRFFHNQVELERRTAELAEVARVALQQKNEFLATRIGTPTA